MGCGTHEHTTMFHKPYQGTQQHSEEYFWYAVVNLILYILPVIVLMTIYSENFKLKSAKILKGTVERTFWRYGVLWGVATTAIGVKGVILYLYITMTIEILPLYAHNTYFSYFVMFNLLMISPLLAIASSIYILLWTSVMEVEVAIPYIFLLPARAVFCCRNKHHAKKLVLFLLIYVLLWNILQLSMLGLILIFAATMVDTINRGNCFTTHNRTLCHHIILPLNNNQLPGPRFHPIRLLLHQWEPKTRGTEDYNVSCFDWASDTVFHEFAHFVTSFLHQREFDN